ncbi:lipoprotein, putative [Shewanella pealeana ATCC 700345]|uniref:Lipoprotein, putative n=1 Tax=Shewanella pealeana (strain ATCC 700345 / ANG-SQ1) TaxID=398579 RepID=A8H2V5_SHEPA|nr:lipoprotein, putative [Shewanella pealeana ATCC 700345]
MRLTSRLTTLSLIVALSSLLSACSSQPEINPEEFAGQVSDSFRTDIKSNGLKLFTYRAILTMESPQSQALPHEVRSNQKKRSRSNKRYQGPDLSVWTAQIEHGLQQTIKMNGYCRDGYIELYRSIQADRGTIRGECNDGADEADLAKFDS